METQFPVDLIQDIELLILFMNGNQTFVPANFYSCVEMQSYNAIAFQTTFPADENV